MMENPCGSPLFSRDVSPRALEHFSAEIRGWTGRGPCAGHEIGLTVSAGSEV